MPVPAATVCDSEPVLQTSHTLLTLMIPQCEHQSTCVQVLAAVVCQNCKSSVFLNIVLDVLYQMRNIRHNVNCM